MWVYLFLMSLLLVKTLQAPIQDEFEQRLNDHVNKECGMCMLGGNPHLCPTYLNLMRKKPNPSYVAERPSASNVGFPSSSNVGFSSSSNVGFAGSSNSFAGSFYPGQASNKRDREEGEYQLQGNTNARRPRCLALKDDQLVETPYIPPPNVPKPRGPSQKRNRGGPRLVLGTDQGNDQLQFEQSSLQAPHPMLEYLKPSNRGGPRLVLGTDQGNDQLQFEQTSLQAPHPMLEYLKPRPRTGHELLVRANKKRSQCMVCRAKKLRAGITDTCPGSTYMDKYCSGCPGAPSMCRPCYAEIHTLP